MKLEMKYLVLKLNDRVNLFCLINELKNLRKETQCGAIDNITIKGVACIILKCIKTTKP